MGFRLISVLQRVDSGSVKVKNKIVGKISRGFVILLGISKTDKETDADYIVENYTEDEKGVRNLKRCLEIIYTKLNLYRLMKPGSKLFEDELTLKVEFPMTVTPDVIRKLIKQEDNNQSYKSMYI